MKIAIVDDHPLVHQGIRSLVGACDDLELVATATSGKEAVTALKASQPDIALVDLKLGDECGLEIIRRGRATAPNCRFIALSSGQAQYEARQALSEEVEGYILKEALCEEVITAIRLVQQGRRYIDPAVVQGLLTRDPNDPLEKLTPRQREVLLALAQGLSNKGIAKELYICPSTVKKHVTEILDKLTLNDRTQAALYAVARGLVSPGATEAKTG